MYVFFGFLSRRLEGIIVVWEKISNFQKKRPKKAICTVFTFHLKVLAQPKVDFY